VQHTWKLNGSIVVGVDIDCRHNFGWTGRTNRFIFRREVAGTSGQTVMQIKFNGVVLAQQTFTPGDGNNAEKYIDQPPTPFTQNDEFSLDIPQREPSSRNATATVDVTRTGP